MTDSELMKDTRTQLGLTQTAMAEKLGYRHQKEISNIETGKERMGNQTREHLFTIRKYPIMDLIAGSKPSTDENSGDDNKNDN